MWRAITDSIFFHVISLYIVICNYNILLHNTEVFSINFFANSSIRLNFLIDISIYWPLTIINAGRYRNDSFNRLKKKTCSVYFLSKCSVLELITLVIEISMTINRSWTDNFRVKICVIIICHKNSEWCEWLRLLKRWMTLVFYFFTGFAITAWIAIHGLEKPTKRVKGFPSGMMILSSDRMEHQLSIHNNYLRFTVINMYITHFFSPSLRSWMVEVDSE